MTREPDDELTPELSQALRGLSSGPEPPAAIESRTAERLRTRGLLPAARHPGTVLLRWVAMAAACVILLAAGFIAGVQHASVAGEPAGNRYVLFLITPADSEQPSTAHEADLVREYSGWARQQHSTGHLITGEKLSDVSFVLTGGAAGGSQENSLDALGGYFIIIAKNMEEAMAIARTCPHLRHGGTIVIRPIVPTP
jgi:hypothetical protein